MPGLPPYIDWTGHGAMAVAPPAVFTGALAAAFAFKIDRDAARHLVDTLLTPGGGGRVHYRPIGGRALVSFMRIARCGSPNHKSWSPGRECAVWLPLLETRAGHLPRLVLWAPFVCIDYAIGMVTGREVWGWPKTYGRIAMAGDPDQTDYACSTMIFRDTDLDAEGREETLLKVAGVTPSTAAVWTRAEEVEGGWAAALALDQEFSGLPFGPTLSAIALKQFPDSARPHLACYQAIVNSPCQVTRMRGGGGLGGHAVLRIANCKSHRLAADLLGVPLSTAGVTEIPIEWGAWFDFDFEALAGDVIAP
jgi:hypothetical protein